MSVRTDTVNLIINVNGNAAQNQLNELRKRAADLTFEMKNNLKKGTEEYIAAAAELKDVKTDMAAIKQQIGITSLSQKELVAELNKLKALKGSMTPFTQEFKDMDRQIKAVESRLYDVKNGVTGLASVFSKVGDSVKQFGLLAASYLGFQFITSQFKNIIQGAGKLSDQLADLQRVTGLTATEADNLNSSLGKIDTRTSTSGLREIALIAGKLGVAKEDIFGFTKAVDQLVVSLGDELGDADQITTQLGKILNVFDGKINGDNITKLGNTFVELANTGASTGAFIADFDQRLSGMAKSAGITLGALSGLGAGLEEMGGRVESSSTAIQKLIVSINSDVPKAARIAGVSVEDFTNLLKTDGTEALLKYSEGLVKNKDSFAAVTASLKDAGEEGTRTIETISKMGQNADYLRGRIDLGRTSIERTSAVTEAFALKNETLGATLDKLGKKFYALVYSSGITTFLKTLVEGFSKVIDIFSKSATAVDKFREAASKVSDLEKSMVPLIDRVDELTKKTTLNKEEQIELNKAIETIGQTIPVAITEFDKYGKAIGISTEKAREFISLQQAMLKVKNAKAIDEATGSLKDLQKELENYQKQLPGLQKAAGDFFDILNERKKAGAVIPESSKKTLDAYDKMLTGLNGKIADLQTKIKGTKGIIDELNGTTLKKSIDDLSKPPAPGDQIDAASVAARRKVLEKLIEDSKVAYEKLNATDKAGQQANLALREKYQKELDALDNKKEKSGSKNSEYDRLKKEAAEFYKQLQKLKEDAANASKSQDEKELIALEQKYQELHAKALEYFKKNVTDRKTYTEEEKLLVEAFNNELAELQKKQQGKLSSDEYADSLKASDDYFAEKKRQTERDYAQGKISQDEYEDSLTQIQALAIKNRIQIAADYSSTVKKAAEDVKTFTIAQEEAITEAERKQMEARKAFWQEEAQARRGIRDTQIQDPSTSPKKRADLKKQNATDDKDAALAQVKERLKKAGEAFDDASVNATDEGKAIWARFNLAIKDADQELIDAKIQALDFFTQTALKMTGDLFTALNNLDQRQLQKDKAINDAKKNNYKKQLDSKLLSQKQYDKKVAEADAELQKKKEAADLKAFKRQQALAITTALINGALAVTSTLAARPGMSDLDTFGISRAIQVAIVVATTAAQVAAIATQAPPDKAARGNWFRKGKKHRDGGIHVEIEKDEAVMKADTMTDGNQYTVTGTPAQITSKLNSIHGGVSWAGGAVIQPAFMRPPAQLNPNLPRIMEQGGIVRQMNSSPVKDNSNDDLLRQLIAKQDELIDEVKNQKDRLHAVVSIKEYRNKEKEYDNSRKAAGMSQ